jgi:hypothetical protein
MAQLNVHFQDRKYHQLNNFTKLYYFNQEKCGIFFLPLQLQKRAQTLQCNGLGIAVCPRGLHGQQKLGNKAQSNFEMQHLANNGPS